MMKKLTPADEKWFINIIYKQPKYTLIPGTYAGIDGVFVRDKWDTICFLHNCDDNRHGGRSDDDMADSKRFCYEYSWMFVEQNQNEMFAPEYLFDTTISTFEPLVKLKLI